jgi:hypothetical protein
VVGGQKIQAGLAHARKTAEVTVEADACPDHRRAWHHHHRAPDYPAA